MLADRTTLTQFLIDERRRHPGASGELNALILDVALACKAISRAVAHGALGGVLGDLASGNVHGETQKKLDVVANEMFLRSNEWGGHLAGMVSEEMEAPYAIPAQLSQGRVSAAVRPARRLVEHRRQCLGGQHLLDPARANPGADADAASDFLQPGSAQVCAGYAIYGPSTMLVLTVGTGVHAFTLDPLLGEFILTHPRSADSGASREFAINASNSGSGSRRCKRYVDECLAGQDGLARQGFQYALDRLAGCRNAPHPDARRRVPVSARHQGSGEPRTAAPAL